MVIVLLMIVSYGIYHSNPMNRICFIKAFSPCDDASYASIELPGFTDVSEKVRIEIGLEKIDEEEYLYILLPGRIKEIIDMGGEWVIVTKYDKSAINEKKVYCYKVKTKDAYRIAVAYPG